MLYRHQVNKQADTVMVDFMFPEGNTLAQLKSDYEFYEPITTHDSSLSKAIYAIIAARIGKDQQSYDFFSQAVQTDLMDVHHNTKNGIHAEASALLGKASSMDLPVWSITPKALVCSRTYLELPQI